MIILFYKEKSRWISFAPSGAAAQDRYAGVAMHDNRILLPPCSQKMQQGTSRVLVQ